MQSLSRATGKPVELRRENGSTVIAGYAAVFYREGIDGTEYNVYGDVRERILPGAFDSVFARNDDVRSMFNHDTNLLLGRTPRTLTLRVDDIGLHYETALPQNSVGRDVGEWIERGDVDGSSFWFGMLPSDWEETADEDGNELLLIRNISKLMEVGPVVFPAYEATTVGTREHDPAWKMHRRSQGGNPQQRQQDIDRADSFCASL